MEPIAIAAATLIAKGMLDGVTNELGKNTLAIARRTIAYVKGKLAHDSEAEAALTMVQARPTDENRVRMLAELLEVRFRNDQEFAGTLTKLVAEAQEVGAIGEVTDSGAIAGGDFNQTGLYNAGRDQKFINRPTS